MPEDVLRMKLTSDYLSCTALWEEMAWRKDLMLWVVGDKERNKLEIAQKIETYFIRNA